MAILDWIKEVPLSAVYKERLVDSEKQISALEKKVSMLETENIELKSRLSRVGWANGFIVLPTRNLPNYSPGETNHADSRF